MSGARPLPPKREAFAQAVAAGRPKRHAYVEAGYAAPNPLPTDKSWVDDEARKLVNIPAVSMRIAEINERAAARVGFTRERAMELLYKLAESEQPHAVAAIRLAAQLNDWFPVQNTDDMDQIKAAAMRRFASMTPDELRAALSRPVTDIIDVEPKTSSE